MKEKLKTVCVFDPGISTKLPPAELFEWARDRDFSKIEHLIDPGDPPTIFHYRRLPRSIMDRYVDAQPSDDGKAVAAFQYGVNHIEHLRTMDGARVNWSPSGTAKTPDGDIPSLTKQEMDKPELSRAEQVEIGTVIWNASFLPRYAKGGYPVPPTSVSLWARIADFPSADASPTTVAPSNERLSGSEGSQPKAQTEKSNGPSGSACEQATGATAQGSTG